MLVGRGMGGRRGGGGGGGSKYRDAWVDLPRPSVTDLYHTKTINAVVLAVDSY